MAGNTSFIPIILALLISFYSPYIMGSEFNEVLSQSIGLEREIREICWDVDVCSDGVCFSNKKCGSNNRDYFCKSSSQCCCNPE
ncbi:unnamed protein product [Amaranthus hypochondriacus]